MTASLLGSTGLIGGHLLEELLADSYFHTVRILIRRPVEISHSKLERKLVDFNDGDSLLVALSNSDVVFCAVGTTQKKVKGDKAAYRQVDYDIPVNTARFCKMTGCKKFIVVSSAGADSKGINFYAKLKGEMEEAVKQEGPEIIYIMRPSMLLGDRKEFRLGESVGKFLMRSLSFLIPEKYKAVEAKTVAKAMIAAAKNDLPGYHIYDNKKILEFSNQ